MPDVSADPADKAALLADPADNEMESAAHTDVESPQKVALAAAEAEDAVAVSSQLRFLGALSSGGGCAAVDEDEVSADRVSLLADAADDETGDAGTAAAARQGSPAAADALASSDARGDGAACEVTDPAAAVGEAEAIRGDFIVHDDSTDDPAAAAAPLALPEASAVAEQPSTSDVVADELGDLAAQTAALLSDQAGSDAEDEQAATDGSAATDGAGPAEVAAPMVLAALVDAAAATAAVTGNCDVRPAYALSPRLDCEPAEQRAAGHLLTPPIKASAIEKVDVSANGRMDDVTVPSPSQPAAAEPLSKISEAGEASAEADAEQSGHAIARSQRSGEVESHPLTFEEEHKAAADLEPRARATARDADAVGFDILQPEADQQDEGPAESEPRTPSTPDASPPTPSAALAAYQPTSLEQTLTQARLSAGQGDAAAAPAAPQRNPAQHLPTVQTMRVVHPDVYFSTTRSALVSVRGMSARVFRFTSVQRLNVSWLLLCCSFAPCRRVLRCAPYGGP